MTDNSPKDDDPDGAGAAAPTAALDPWGADTVADGIAMFTTCIHVGVGTGSLAARYSAGNADRAADSASIG